MIYHYYYVNTHQKRNPDIVWSSHDPVQLDASFLHPVDRLAGVDHEDDGVRGPRVRLPQRPDLLLASDIPHQEGQVPWSTDEAADPFAVKADCRDRVHVLVKFQPEKELLKFG